MMIQKAITPEPKQSSPILPEDAYKEGLDDSRLVPLDEDLEQTNEINPNLKCMICKKIWYKPQICYSCKQYYCTPCISNYERTHGGLCYCKSPFMKEPDPKDKISLGPENKYLMYCLVSLKLYCRYRADGCQEEVHYENLSEHEDTCEHRVMKCLMGDCNERMKYKDLKKHEAICLHRIKGCMHCNQIYKLEELTEHELKCNERHRFCGGCKLLMPNADYQQHTNWCPEVFKSCQKCGKMMPKHMPNLHTKVDCVATHFGRLTIMSKVQGQQLKEKLIDTFEKEEECLFHVRCSCCWRIGEESILDDCSSCDFLFCMDCSEIGVLKKCQKCDSRFCPVCSTTMNLTHLCRTCELQHPGPAGVKPKPDKQSSKPVNSKNFQPLGSGPSNPSAIVPEDTSIVSVRPEAAQNSIMVDDVTPDREQPKSLPRHSPSNPKTLRPMLKSRALHKLLRLNKNKAQGASGAQQQSGETSESANTPQVV